MNIPSILVGAIFLLVQHPVSKIQSAESHYVIQTVPPENVTLNIGEPMHLTCSVNGKPFWEINWYLNSGDVPSKCLSTSQYGIGTLTCPDIQDNDAGAYLCEADNLNDAVMYVGTTILIVNANGKLCPAGKFNDNARTSEECITCFCFGLSNRCESSNLFVDQLRKPFDRLAVVLVRAACPLKIQDELESKVIGVQLRIPNGVKVWTYPNQNLTGLNIPYFVVPKTYYGPNILNSYGGYLNYTIYYLGEGIPTNAPDVIISGNGIELLHRGGPIKPDSWEARQVRFFFGNWIKNGITKRTLATREEIMRVLAKVDNIFIKAQYDHSPILNVNIIKISMDTANAESTSHQIAYHIENCSCPDGYYGNSCEQRNLPHKQQVRHSLVATSVSMVEEHLWIKYFSNVSTNKFEVSSWNAISK